MPERDVGELHLQLGEVGRTTLRARDIRGHHVGDERAHRFAVAGDVVDHDEDDVLEVVDAMHADADRSLHGDVETRTGGGEQVGFLGEDSPVEFGAHTGRVPDDLSRCAVDRREHRAEHFLTLDDVDHRGTQRGEVELAAQAQGDRDVVGRRAGVELVDEPDALLRIGQRDLIRARAYRGDRREAGYAVGDALRELTHARCVEEVADADLDAERRTGASRNPHRGQGVAAEIEEGVDDRDPLDPEDLGDDSGQGLLGRRRRLDDLGLGHGGRRQRAPVDLAGGVTGHLVEDDPQCRAQVGEQPFRGEGADRVDVHGVARMARQVGDERITRGGGGHRGSSGDHARRGGQDCLGLAEFDALPVDLDLEVGATEILEFTVGAPACEVAGPVQPRARWAGRVGDERLGGQRRRAGIPAGHLRATQVQLAGNAGRHRAEAVVEDPGRHARCRAADGDDLDRFDQGPDRRVHRHLGRPVLVDDHRVRGGRKRLLRHRGGE